MLAREMIGVSNGVGEISMLLWFFRWHPMSCCRCSHNRRLVWLLCGVDLVDLNVIVQPFLVSPTVEGKAGTVGTAVTHSAEGGKCRVFWNVGLNCSG